MMLESERVAIAAHLHVQLRRLTGRVTDTEWMAHSVDYADEVVRLARQAALEKGHAELDELAGRLEAAMQARRPPPKTRPVVAAAVAPARSPQEVAADLQNRYVGRLR
jgi:hypothetical protein